MAFRLQSGTSGMSGLPLTQDFLGQCWGVDGRVFGGSRNSATGWANSIFLVGFREMDDGFDKLRVFPVTWSNLRSTPSGRIKTDSAGHTVKT